MIATLFDRITVHGPEGFASKARCEPTSFKEAARERDGGAPITDR